MQLLPCTGVQRGPSRPLCVTRQELQVHSPSARACAVRAASTDCKESDIASSGAAEQDALRQDSGNAAEPSGTDPLFVSFAGGGLYFFWQLGAVKYLREHYDITNVPMAGASSGSLIACLAACGIDPDVTLKAAYDLSLKADIWNRKLGVLGIWGPLIREWLDDLLPDDAHTMVNGRLHVIIAKAPTLNLFEVTEFTTKEDLIEAVLASCHIPFVLDGKPFARFRDEWCWDGSFPDFVYFDNSENLKRGGRSLVIDYSMDEQLDWVRGDFVKLRTYPEIQELMAKGYAYAKRQYEAGEITGRFDTEPHRLQL